MFKSRDKRYMTKGVNEQVPLELQVFCWECINKKGSDKTVQLDYFQVFEINPDVNRGRVEVIHRQEEPFFIQYHDIELTKEMLNSSVKKIWVIDDGTNQTMLLPEEY